MSFRLFAFDSAQAATRWLSEVETRWLSEVETRWLSEVETRWLSEVETTVFFVSLMFSSTLALMPLPILYL